MKSKLGILILLLPTLGWAQANKGARIVPCDEKKSHEVKIPQSKVTVMNFPVKPKEIVPGDNVFDFKHIKNDLAIKALNSAARTNVFVYLENRRCAFSLITVSGSGDEIVLIRDDKENEIEVKFRE